MTAAIRDYRSSMGGQVVRQTMNLAAALLAGIATACIVCLLDEGVFVAARDPVLLVSSRLLFIAVAVASLAVAFICLGRITPAKSMLLLWLGLNLGVYAGASVWMGRANESAHLGTLAGTFKVPPGAMQVLAVLVLALIFLAGVSSLLWFWLGGHMKQASRMSCPSCGGHVEFAVQNAGQQIPCPHCSQIVTLRGREMLKMSCYFCKEHIEFPAHALGTRMPCPHCKRDISLKELQEPL